MCLFLCLSSCFDLFCFFDTYESVSQDSLMWTCYWPKIWKYEQGRREIGNFTLEGIAHQIECPMLIGYNKDDRSMDPRGALRLYQEATNSNREMLEGGESWWKEICA